MTTVRTIVSPGDLAGAAALAGVPADEFAADLAALPDGIRPVALCDGERVAAIALDIEREIARTGRATLVRLRAPGDPAAAVALVDWFERRARETEARALDIGVADAPGLADTLLARGYAHKESYITMRRACARKPPPPLPEGVRELTLAEIGVDGYLACGNAAFEGVPGAFPLTADDFARVRIERKFRETLVRAIADAHGPIGFMRGAWAPGEPGEVEAIGVVERARGRGLGRWLLHRCEELLEREGATEILLLVAATNRRAHALYVADGYVQVARRDTFARDLAPSGA